MMIACDLDRTLIPNGKEDYDGSLPQFYDFISKIPQVTLVYATGRNLKLFEEGEVEYNLKKPDYLLGSVGTEVYEKIITNDGDEKMTPDPDWKNYVLEKHPNWNRHQIVRDLSSRLDSETFFLQEEELQNLNKISYYLKDLSQKEKIISNISEYLRERNIQGEVVYSFDPHKDSGLIDVLPRSATKLGALEFLINKLNKDRENVIYSGDSGNDLLPLTAGIKAVLVNNAPNEVKVQAKEIARNKGFEDKLYIAKGNYSAGVIEGLKHFRI